MAESYTLKSQLIKNDSRLYPLQFLIDDKVSQSLKADKVKRLKLTINGHPPIDSSLISNGEQQYFVKINKYQMKKMFLQIGDSATLILTPDTSKYGMPLPE